MNHFDSKSITIEANSMNSIHKTNFVFGCWTLYVSVADI